jgi:hypothetical protein
MRSADNNWDFWTLLPEALHQVTVVMSDRGIPPGILRRRPFSEISEEIRFAMDSPLEEGGFEPSVPPSRARCVIKTVLTDPRLFPRERNPGRGTEGPHPACSAEESVSPVPSMATGAKAGADVAIDIAECGESRGGGQLPEVSVNGQVAPGRARIRHQFVDFTGAYVLHCHMLAHEGRGMMQLVRLVKAEIPGLLPDYIPEHH